MTEAAKIYQRMNGSLGAACDGTADTGHYIDEEDGKFTVWSIIEDGHLCTKVTREEAEKAIADEWRAPQ
jgi:hypothetical protein